MITKSNFSRQLSGQLSDVAGDIHTSLAHDLNHQRIETVGGNHCGESRYGIAEERARPHYRHLAAAGVARAEEEDCVLSRDILFIVLFEARELSIFKPGRRTFTEANKHLRWPQIARHDANRIKVGFANLKLHLMQLVFGGRIIDGSSYSSFFTLCGGFLAGLLILAALVVRHEPHLEAV